jgi:hypothetical protein
MQKHGTIYQYIIRKTGPSASFLRFNTVPTRQFVKRPSKSNFFGHRKKLFEKKKCASAATNLIRQHHSKTVKPPKNCIFSRNAHSMSTKESSDRNYLRFRIVVDDASPPRLISHHASSSPLEGLIREQTTASSSATSTSGKAESAGTAGNEGRVQETNMRIKKPCRRRNPQRTGSGRAVS